MKLAAIKLIGCMALLGGIYTLYNSDKDRGSFMMHFVAVSKLLSPWQVVLGQWHLHLNHVRASLSNSHGLSHLSIHALERLGRRHLYVLAQVQQPGFCQK